MLEDEVAGGFINPLNPGRGSGLILNPGFNPPQPGSLDNELLFPTVGRGRTPTNTITDMSAGTLFPNVGRNRNLAPRTRDILRMPWADRGPQINQPLLNQQGADAQTGDVAEAPGGFPWMANRETMLDRPDIRTDIGTAQPEPDQPGFTMPLITDDTERGDGMGKSPYRSELEIQAEKVISDMLSGGWTEPLRERQTEATARSAMQQRGAMAARAAQAGITGQGIGAQAMEGTEANIRQQVADNILATEIAEQQAKERGIMSAIAERQVDLGELEAAFTEADRAITTGNYGAANRIIEGVGQTPLDFSKLEAGDYRTVLNDIDNLIEKLGPDAPPALLQYLSGLRSSVTKTVWSKMGVDIDGTFTDADGNQVNLDDILASFQTPDEPTTAETQAALASLETNLSDWWTNSADAETVRVTLSANTAGQELLASVEAGDTDAIQQFGFLVGAAYAQHSENGLTNDSQRSILQKYGLYDSASDITNVDPLTMDSIETNIMDKIRDGQIDSAKQAFKSLDPAQKNYLVGSTGDFQVLVDRVAKEKAAARQGSNGETSAKVNGSTFIFNADGEAITDLDGTLEVLRGSNDPDSDNYNFYKYLSNTAPQGNLHISVPADNDISLTQAKENSIIILHGRLVWVSDITREGVGFGGGRAKDVVTVTDLVTGKSKTFNGKSSDDNSLYTLDNWLGGLNALEQQNIYNVDETE